MGEWMARERWDRLVAGEGCRLCESLEAPGANDDDASDAIGYTVAELAMSVVKLGRDQFAAGYCVVVCKPHVAEPHDLPPGEREAFLAEVMRVGAAVQRAFEADKMNYQILGNAVPHTHGHVVPRYWGDPAPARPYFGDPEHPVLVSEREYLRRAARVRSGL